MRTSLFILIMAVSGLVCFNTSCRKSEDIKPHIGENITINELTVSIQNKDSSFSDDTKQWMTNVFFMVYPKLTERFNDTAPKKIVFIIDPAFNKRPAETKDSTITFNAGWFRAHPNDIDLVTRQLMLVVGGYAEDAAPSWIIEGMADYARYTYGVDNEDAGWELPEVTPDQNYKETGKVTARFLVWLERRVNNKVIDELNEALQIKSYTADFWKTNTGRNIDMLWQLYQGDPSIATSYPPAVFARAATFAQESLMNQFWSKDHFFVTNNHGNQGYNYWWNAHGLDVFVDGYLRTHAESFKDNINLIYQGMYAKNGNTFINDFNDDMEWMALASLRAYDATHLNEYKITAQMLWEKIKESWSDVAGGGITWKTNEPNGKNACSNAPAAILAARLYEHDHNEEDLEWAKKIFAWEKAILVDPVTGAVWDNVHMESDSSLTIKKEWTFTYNQGTYIGAATELFRITKDSSYLKEAVKTANTVVHDASFTSNGVLKESGQGDGGLFKGIFIRYFNDLIMSGFLDDAIQQEYIDFVVSNGRSLMNNGSTTTMNGDVFNSDWGSPPADGHTDASSEISGVMLYEALAKLQQNGLVN